MAEALLPPPDTSPPASSSLHHTSSTAAACRFRSPPIDYLPSRPIEDLQRARVVFGWQFPFAVKANQGSISFLIAQLPIAILKWITRTADISKTIFLSSPFLKAGNHARRLWINSPPV